MSSMLGGEAETQQQQQKGQASFLSQEERSALSRMLGFPEDLPDAHKAWLIDYIRVNLSQFPIGSIQGFPRSRGLELISTLSLSTVGSFNFENISQEFIHLQLVLYARGDTAATTVEVRLRFNGDTGSNYGYQFFFGQGSTAVASAAVGQASAAIATVVAANGTANRVGYVDLNVPHYTNTDFQKTLIASYMHFHGTGASDRAVGQTGAIWASSSAINRIEVFPVAGNFVASSRCDLIGLRNPS